MVLGTCAMRPGASALVQRPTQSGHWLVDYALNPSWAAGKYRRSERPDGLARHVPTEALEADYGEGVEELTTGAIPVSWIDSQDRLTSIVSSLVVFFDRRGDDPQLGALCREAQAATSD